MRFIDSLLHKLHLLQFWSWDYRGKCGNCHKPLKDGDKYCRYCGTKRGKGKFLPYYNLQACIYGPAPIKRTHICKACNTVWSTMLMIPDEKFCPNCGGRAEIVKDEIEPFNPPRPEMDEMQTGTIIPHDEYLAPTLELDHDADLENAITLSQGDQSVTFFPLIQATINIGRSSKTDFTISHPRVSREHASIIFEEGRWYIVDQAATNGTKLNGQHLAQFKKAALSNGDRICLGDAVTITVEMSSK